MVNINLVDGSNLFYANYFKLKQLARGGAFGFLRSIFSVNFPSSDKTIVAWDGGKSERRMKICPEYKATRPKRDKDELDDMFHQMGIVEDLLQYTNILSIRISHVEADDIIASIVMFMYKNRKLNCCVISADTDFYQLLQFNGTTIYNPIKKRFIDISELPVEPNRHAFYKCLTGDVSDNISGIPGVGPIRAAKILNKKDKKLIDKYIRGNEEIIKRNLAMIDFLEIPKQLATDVAYTVRVKLEEKNKNRMENLSVFIKKCKYYGMPSLAKKINYSYF